MPVKFMATKVLYGHERAQVCRMMLHITRTLRDCYAPDLGFAEASDLMWVLCEVFIAHANGRPPGASKLARSLEMPRTTLLRKLGRLTELGLVVRVGRSYCLTEKINPPNLRGLARSHVSQMTTALNSMSKMNDQELTRCAGARHVALTGGRMHEITRNRAHVMKP